MITRFSFCCLLVLSIAASCIAQPDYSDLDSIIAAKSRAHKFSGAVLVAENGKVVYTKAVGKRTVSDSLSIDNPMHIASCSKPITAIAILMLHERGLLNIDDPFTKYFPDLPYEGVTLRQMLSHTSGFFYSKNWMVMYRQRPDKNKPLTSIDLYNRYKKKKPKLEFKPGEQFRYSNDAYEFFPLIVEKVTGQPFDEFMKKTIFEPVGMTNTFVYVTSKLSDTLKMAESLTTHKGKYWTSGTGTINNIAGSNMICTTVHDLYKLERALYTNQLLSDSAKKLAFTPVKLNDGMLGGDKLGKYSLGWYSTTEDIRYHTGSYMDYSSYFMRELKNQHTIIILTNTRESDLATLLTALYKKFGEKSRAAKQ